MFHTPARKEIAIASPVRSNGQAFTPTSDRLSQLPKAPPSRAPKATTGLVPEIATRRALTTKAPTSATKEGTIRVASSFTGEPRDRHGTGVGDAPPERLYSPHGAAPVER